MKTFDLCILSHGKELTAIKNSSVFARYNTIYVHFPREGKKLKPVDQSTGQYNHDDVYSKVDHLEVRFTEEDVKNSIANSR